METIGEPDSFIVGEFFPSLRKPPHKKKLN